MHDFNSLKQTYLDRWNKLHVRPASAHDIDHDPDAAVDFIFKHKDVYQACSVACHGIPWFFFGPVQFREMGLGSGTFDKYLGNGQSLHRKTTVVPINRGPFPDFQAGAYDAMKIQGFVGATDWSLERICYRWEGYNGFGYEGKCAPPYLYAGTTAYGPPEAAGGLYVHDHDFQKGVVDKRLGTVAILRRMMDRDGSISIPDAIPGPQPEDTVKVAVTWAQGALNKLYSLTLVVDGKLGPLTMAAVRHFQEDKGLVQTGLLDSLTMTKLHEAAAPPAEVPTAGPENHPVGIDVLGFLDSLFHHGERHV